ncbi:MAG: STAS domain-containing protein [Pseudomonadales bacterium]|nr:STAS domain-containing protein [Pseudomonadales bacterium]
MADNLAGKILLAHHDTTYVMRLVGDIRVNLCTSIDSTILSIFKGVTFDTLIVDLSETEGIDSTTLGFLARIALYLKNERGIESLIYSPHPSITHLLESMSFGTLFHIHTERPVLAMAQGAVEVSGVLPDEDIVRSKVIEAHRVLMSLSEQNKHRFCELVDNLEQGL